MSHSPHLPIPSRVILRLNLCVVRSLCFQTVLFNHRCSSYRRDKPHLISFLEPSKIESKTDAWFRAQIKKPWLIGYICSVVMWETVCTESLQLHSSRETLEKYLILSTPQLRYSKIAVTEMGVPLLYSGYKWIIYIHSHLGGIWGQLGDKLLDMSVREFPDCT